MVEISCIEEDHDCTGVYSILVYGVLRKVQGIDTPERKSKQKGH